jgi:hypothetical protein
MKEAKEVNVRLSARHKARRYQVQYDYDTGEPRCVSVYMPTGGMNSSYNWRAIWNDKHPLGGIAAVAVREAERDDMQQYGTPGEDH